MIAGVGVLTVLLVAAAIVRHFSNPEYIEKRLAAEIGPGYQIDIASAHYNPFLQTFHAEGVSVVPDTLWRAPESGTAHPRRRSSFSVSSVRANGVNFLALRKGHIDIDGIVIDRPEIRLLTDRGLPPDSSAMTPRRMPHEIIMSSGKRLRIDTIRVVDGDIRYSEQGEDGSRPGTFRFAALNATIANLTNDATRMQEPCVIDVRTRLADSGPLEAKFELDLSSDVLRMDCRAAIGRMDAASLNDLLIDLEGIRINEGIIDSTWFDIKIDGDVATGEMRLLYHGLEFEIIDKDTYEQGIGDHLASFIHSWKTHESNPDDEGETATVITLRRERAPQISLMKFVWETVREGALRTVGAL